MRSKSYGISVDFGSLFLEHKFSTAEISHITCRSATKFGSVRGSGQSTSIHAYIGN